MEFDTQYSRLLEQLSDHKSMMLFTATDCGVVSRMVSVIIIKGLFYFQTDQKIIGTAQRKINNNTTLSADNFQIEGVCRDIGLPTDNPLFCEMYSRYFDGDTPVTNAKLLVVEPVYIRRWEYDDDRPYEIIVDIKNRSYQKIIHQPR